jgi:hypothetical protein
MMPQGYFAVSLCVFEGSATPQILKQEDLMTKQCSADSTKKILEYKAKIARQQRAAEDFSSAEEHDNRNTLLYRHKNKQ